MSEIGNMNIPMPGSVPQPPDMVHKKRVGEKEEEKTGYISQDKVTLYQRKKTEGFSNKLQMLKKELLTTHGKAYIGSMGIMGLGFGVLSSIAFGPALAVAGALAGVTAGVAVGMVMNTPLKWLKPWSKEEASPQVPLPGSDAKTDPVQGESALLKPELQKEIDQVTQSEITQGNSVTLLKNGAESFPERYKLMESAKKSINLQTLIFQDDETGWQTAKLLAKKAKEGVQCRVVYDWISSPNQSKIFDYMQKNGVQVVAFNPPLDYKWHKENTQEIKEFMKEGWQQFKKHLGDRNLGEFMKWAKERQMKHLHFWWNNSKAFVKRIKQYPPVLLHRLNNRWHQKLLTVDNKAAIVGGMNIGSDYAYGGTDKLDFSKGPHSQSCKWMRDTDVKIEGPGVDKVIDAFAENWQLAGGKNPENIRSENPPAEKNGDTPTRFMAHWPLEKQDKNIENWYYKMLDNAQDTAYITNPYFIPNEDFVKHLCDAAKRGVDVRIITNSVNTNDLDILSQAGRDSYDQLLNAGVRMYELQPHSTGIFRSLHAKTAVFDGEASTIGSHNLDPRSFDLNSENSLTIHDRKFGKDMMEMFKEDLQECQEVTKEDLQYETPADRVEQWFYGKVMDFLL